MQTKLSRYCEGIIEAAWLAALILVPLFFNIYSSRIFEPDKLTLLRSIALLILGAWLVKIIDEGGVRREGGKIDLSFKSLLRIPLLLPVFVLVVVYVIATIFSVNPSVSLWGSYQRLQGTYTTFSYLVVFAAILGNMRKRIQVERLITVAIVTSLPISLYGILQRYRLDPIPWGGDVIERIAGNMGNSIFLAAYLIMVMPYTLMRIIESFRAILSEKDRLGAQVARATAYVFTAALQLIALYMTGSRGPWLGWMAGSFFFFIILSLYWHKRKLMLGVMAAGAVLAVFLVLLQIPNGPLESLRQDPRLARLGHLLAAESDTGRVRVLIWQGAVKLVAPHTPLEYPDGKKDPFNFLRPVIGYGPESMYVAYNPFYPPELGNLEKRNASPDRSHNETWDSLVITGVAGLLVYLWVFGAVFYYGLRWMGFINDNRQRNLFLAFYLGGGVIGAIGVIAWRGIEYFGVGMPAGMIAGVVMYLVLAALFSYREAAEMEREPWRALILTAAMAVVVGHFIEANFGIAIAATRTYFWVSAALMVVIGYIFPLYSGVKAPLGEAASEEPSRQAASSSSQAGAARKKQRRPASRPATKTVESRWGFDVREAVIGGIFIALILGALAYDFVSNAQGGKYTTGVLWSSLVEAKTPSGGISYGLFAMVFTSWLIASIAWGAETARFHEDVNWLKVSAYVLGISAFLALIYWFWHAGRLASLVGMTANSIDDIISQVKQYEGMLTILYLFVFLEILGAAFFLPAEWPTRQYRSAASMVAAPFILLVVLFLASYTNLRVIQADIAFKMAEPFSRPGQWPVTIAIYNHANDLAPSEDFYYLFLGRAYIEHSKSITDANEREALFAQAERDLEKAQRINPLNTDHTANLARLNSLWASSTQDQNLRQERAQRSSDYFARAVVLSPYNSRLWDEWAILLLETMGQPDQAFEKLQRAAEIDPKYDWTFALLGQYYSRLAHSTQDAAAKTDALQKAVDSFNRALDLPDTFGGRMNHYLSLGSLYTEMNQVPKAIEAYQEALKLGPDQTNKWKIEMTIAQLYAGSGDTSSALQYANQALASAPDDQKPAVQSFVDQLAPK